LKALVTLIVSAVGLSVCLQGNVVAADLDTLRLFFEPPGANTNVNTKTQPPGSSHPLVPPVLPKIEPDRRTNVKEAERLEFKYDGFINGPSGKRYFINGLLLANLPAVELVSASDSGRILELKTGRGVVFTLSLGETKTVTPGYPD